MQGGKSPGIDGLPKEFYVAFWQLVEEDLNQVLQGSIEQGELPLSMRRAVISPIFKKGDKTLLENWRPISLLNTDYKILTKALTNRLKGVIISLVEPDQTGFIPGRLIQTNISTVRDLIKKNNGLKWGADLSRLGKGLRPTGKIFPRKGHGIFQDTGTLHQAS